MTAHPFHKVNQASPLGRKNNSLSLLCGAAVLLAAGLASAQTQTSVSLAWDPCSGSGIAGYRVYWGSASHTYTNTTDVGNAAKATLSGLKAGGTYYCAVSSYSSSGLESPLSTELVYTCPNTTTPPVVALTSPTSGSKFTTPATINLAAAVTANGHTINKVQFYSGSTLLGERTAAPYTYTWTSASAGTYSLSATALYDGGATVSCAPVSITVAAGLPAPWQAADLGTVSVPGNASVTNGLYRVASSGNLSGSADNFRFLYQPMSGDGEIRAKVLAITGNNTNARAGVMIRESLTPGSRYAFMGVSPNGRFGSQTRSSTSGSTASTTSSSGTLPNTWVRLVRSGNTLTSYRSTNGSSWTQVSTQTITMATNIYLGFAVASGTTTLSTGTFSNASVTP